MSNKEYLKERREMLIRNHFCVDCKKQDARTLIGKARCFECYEKARIKRSGLEIPRNYRNELGLCSMCMNSVKEGFKVCEECYKRVLKASDGYRNKHTQRPKVDYSTNPQMPRSEWVKNGFCRTCGDKAMEGYKVCESCRQHLVNISLSRKQLAQDSFWRNSMHSFFINPLTNM